MFAFIFFVVIVAFVSFVLGREMRDEETFAKEQWEKMFKLMSEQQKGCEYCEKSKNKKD